MMASGRFGAPAIRWRMRKISCFSISVKKIRGWQYWTKWQGRFLIWVRWRVFFSTLLIWLPNPTGLWCTAWRNWGHYGKGNSACTKKPKRVWTTISWYWIRWCCFCWWREIKDKQGGIALRQACGWNVGHLILRTGPLKVYRIHSHSNIFISRTRW